MADQSEFDPGVLDRAHSMAWHIGTLAEALKDPGNRESFVSDPEALLREHGIDSAFLPPGAVESLVAMGPEELEAISKYSDKLIEAGFYLEATAGGAGAQQDPRISFF